MGTAALIAVVLATPWSLTVELAPLWPVAFLSVAAVVGELLPIRFPRAGGETRSLSTSAPFVLALIPVAGLGVAMVVQLLASLIDDVRWHRAPLKSLFNSGQYALSVAACGAVFAGATGVPVADGPMLFSPADVPDLLVAGVAMIATNWILVAGVVSLSTGIRLIVVLGEDLRVFVVTNLVLLSVGGLAADIAADGVGLLVLLAAPVAAAHIFAAAAARHAHDATHDSLTGLGNRGQLDRELEHGLASARAEGADGPGLVLIDLDHFKDFNDTLGHPVGDSILREVARRLVEAAPGDATVHRLGGDEFAVVVHADGDRTLATARELLGSFDDPTRVGSLELLVRASAGVAVAPDHGLDAETLMKNADIALYHAKLERDRISPYSPEFDINTVERLKLLADLHAALDSRALHVVYQPQVDLSDGSVVAVEALARWEHPERGLVEPDEFIPLAENSGLIYQLTNFVLNRALADLACWREAGSDVRIAVNVSARHLSDIALPDQIAELLDRHDVPARSLVLEVTETGILSDPARADVVIRAVRALGVDIAIDDYGTGNASLSYLKRLEIDELKVDRSFVTTIGDDRHDLIIVRSTIELALALDLRVVAEGVEDEPTAEALRQLGGVIGQGYHLGQPMPAPAIASLLGVQVPATDAASGR